MPNQSFPTIFQRKQQNNTSASPANKEEELAIPGYREDGQVATNWELATGNERYEYLKRLRGEEPWEEMKPLYLTSKPTTKNPYVLTGSDPERYVGCTGEFKRLRIYMEEGGTETWISKAG
jgi:hypothetical protein